MDVFALAAKISLDTNEYTTSLDEASGKTQTTGEKIKSGLATAAKVGDLTDYRRDWSRARKTRRSMATPSTKTRKKSASPPKLIKSGILFSNIVAHQCLRFSLGCERLTTFSRMQKQLLAMFRRKHKP